MSGMHSSSYPEEEEDPAPPTEVTPPPPPPPAAPTRAVTTKQDPWVTEGPAATHLDLPKTRPPSVADSQRVTMDPAGLRAAAGVVGAAGPLPGGGLSLRKVLADLLPDIRPLAVATNPLFPESAELTKNTEALADALEENVGNLRDACIALGRALHSAADLAERTDADVASGVSDVVTWFGEARTEAAG